MDNLKNFIESNRADFEEIHEVDLKFAGKLYKKSRFSVRTRFLWSLSAVAAVMVVTFGSVMRYNEINSVEYQLKYYESARAELISEILEVSIMSEEETQSIIEIIVQEPTPMVEMIPEYMAENEKIEIIKDYENRRLLALGQLLEPNE